MPLSAAVYGVVSGPFSPAVLSNLSVLAGLTEKDRGKPSWDDVQPKDLWYSDSGGNRTLGVLPDRGHAVIRSKNAIALPHQPVEGVPSESEALRLAEAILPKIGIDRAQLAHRAGSDQVRYTKGVQRRGSFDKQQGKIVTTEVARAVFLIRSFGGVPSFGWGRGGGIWFNFGNHGQLAELDLTWRAAEPMRLRAAATKEQFVDWLRKGQCVCRLDQPERVRALIVTNVSAYYLELSGREQQQEIYPMAELEAAAQLAETNLPVRLYCPLLTSGE
jgi:hypothetical protein